MDVHEYLYDEESALFGSAYSDIYDNSIRCDGLRSWTSCCATWRARGYLENTLVAIGSDHGEAFRERGFEGHAREVYRETTEVPLILSFPFRLEPGIVVEARTRNVDIWPTCSTCWGSRRCRSVDGRSLRAGDPGRGARRARSRSDAAPAIAHLDQTWGQQDPRSRRPPSRSPSGASATCDRGARRGGVARSSSTPAATRASCSDVLAERAGGGRRGCARSRSATSRADAAVGREAPTRELDELAAQPAARARLRRPVSAPRRGLTS